MENNISETLPKNEEQERLVEIINDFFGADAAYYDVNPWDLAAHLHNNGVGDTVSLALRMVDLQKQVEALRELVRGEWVDTDLVEKALDIDFSIGMALFDFSRTAEWNPPPLNGQKVTTKFKIKAPILKVAKWVRYKDSGRTLCSRCCSRALRDEEGRAPDLHYPFKRSSWCPTCGAAMMREVEERDGR